MSTQMLMWSNGGGYAGLGTAAHFVGQGAFPTLSPFIQFECPQAGTIHSLYVDVETNTSDVSHVITVRKNGTGDGNQVTTVTAAATGVFKPATNTPFTVAAGDLIDINITSAVNAGTNIYNSFALMYTITAPNVSLAYVANKVGGNVQISTASSNYASLVGQEQVGLSAQTAAGFVERETVSYTYLRTYIPLNAATSGASIAISTDGTDTALLAVITAATTGEFVNTATTISISSGAVVSYRISNTSNTGAGTSFQISSYQVQRNTSWAYIGANNGSSGVITSATRTLFWPLGGFASTGNTTEGSVQMQAQSRFRTRNMQVNIPANAGGTTVCFRVNGANAITLPLSSGQIGTFLDSTQGPSLAATDLINWSIQCSTAAVTGGFTIAGILLEMQSIDTIPFRTLMGVGV